MKKYFLLTYHPDLIKLFIDLSGKSTAASLITAFFIMTLFYNHIPIDILSAWFILSIAYIFLKTIVVNRMQANINHQEKCEHYIKVLIPVTLLSSLLWGSLSWMIIIYGQENYDFLVLGVLFGLMSGAISTLSPIYIIYIVYTLPMATMLFASFLYVSEEVHTYIAILLILFAYIVVSASYRMYQSLSQTIVLKEMLESSQVELEAINHSLENRIKKAVHKSREQELKLLQQSRLAQMGEMISMIAHQWRQPLAAISATALSLNMKVAMNKYDKDFFYENINKISEFSQYLSNTIDDFRNFFKSNKNKERFYMRDVVKGSLAIINTSLESKGIEVITRYDDTEQVFSYFNELRQVCLNLLKNGEDVLLLKKIEAPKIWVRTYNTDQHVFLEICDNAGGIDSTIIDKIFDPYFTTKEQYDGTGLGLYMSRTIIEEHCAGQLSVKNSEKGAVFTIALSLERTEN